MMIEIYQSLTFSKTNIRYCVTIKSRRCSSMTNRSRKIAIQRSTNMPWFHTCGTNSICWISWLIYMSLQEISFPITEVFGVYWLYNRLTTLSTCEIRILRSTDMPWLHICSTRTITSISRLIYMFLQEISFPITKILQQSCLHRYGSLFYRSLFFGG